MILEGNFVFKEKVGRQQVAVSYDNKVKCWIISKIAPTIGPPDWKFPDQTLIFPSFIDLHVHARQDPTGIESYKEDYFTCVKAALNGGVTAFMDMPNNPQAPPINEESYYQKLQLAERVTAKFGIPIILYAGIIEGSSPLKKFEVPYKIFFHNYKNIEQLEKSLQKYANYQHAVSFHAEDGAEVEIAIALSQKYGLKCTICHLSTAEGLQICRKKRAEGVEIKIEITPHHLLFYNDNNTLDKYLTVKPKIGSKQDQIALLEALKAGEIDFLATDHAPHTSEEKQGPYPLSGVPHLDTYGLVVAKLIKELGVSVLTINKVAAHAPGKVFNYYLKKFYPHYPSLGEIKVGYLASFTAIDFEQTTKVTKDILFTKVKHSPFEGYTFPAKILKLGPHWNGVNYD